MRLKIQVEILHWGMQLEGAVSMQQPIYRYAATRLLQKDGTATGFHASKDFLMMIEKFRGTYESMRY
jgi:hypothetical protein